LSADWATNLVRLFAGNDGTGGAAACSSPERNALANNYKRLFTDNCTSPANQPNQCGAIKHLFRLSDNSSTTQFFKMLVGAASGIPITGFCNGTDQQDNDPIRRDCTSDEQVCSADNKLGLLLPIVVPDFIYGGAIHTATKCQDGKFGFRPSALLDPTCCVRSAQAGCLRTSTFTKCQTPLGADDRPCLNGNQTPNSDLRPNLPVGWPKVAGRNMNPGIFNLVVRNNDTTGAARFFEPERTVQVTRAFYRIHSTTGGRNHAGTLTSTTLCAGFESTQHLGCLTQAPNSTCSLGLAEFDTIASKSPALAEPLSYPDEPRTCTAYGTWQISYSRFVSCGPGTQESFTIDADPAGNPRIVFHDRGPMPSECGPGWPGTYDAHVAVSNNGCVVRASSHAAWCYGGEGQCKNLDLVMVIRGSTAEISSTNRSCWCGTQGQEGLTVVLTGTATRNP
jgi:hypothetical protein